MRTGIPDLDDVDQLLAADVDGLLRAAALSGAQVRAIAEAQREGVAARLAELRPRSVAIVHGDSTAAAGAADFVVALISARIDVPIVAAPTLPGWIGALDVVVVIGDDAGQQQLAEAAARARRRHAELVVVAPMEGPLADAAGGASIDLSPRLDIEPRFRFAGSVAALVLVLMSLEQVRWQGTKPQLNDIADALDVEAAANHASRETFRNRAKLLATRVEGGHPVWAGDTPGAVAVADHAARVVRTVAGQVSGAADLMEVLRTAHDVWPATDSAADSMFYDPLIDGPRAEAAPRVLVATTERREWLTAQRVRGLPDVDVLVGTTAEVEPGASREGADRPAAPMFGEAATDVDPADDPADVGSLLVLAARVDMAAVYLRLVGRAAQ